MILLSLLAPARADELAALQSRFERFTAAQLSGDSEADARLLKSKEKELAVLELLLGDYLDREPAPESAAQARLLEAKAPLYVADLGRSLDCPADMGPTDCRLYRVILRDRVWPQFDRLEQAGVRRLQDLVDDLREGPALQGAREELWRRTRAP